MTLSQTLSKKRRNVVNKEGVEAKLTEELERLKRLYNMGHELRSVRWMPSPDRDKEGEVKDGVIYIYTEAQKATRVLRHEFLHYLLSKPAKMYEKIVNAQGSLIRSLLAQMLEEAYREEEFIVDRLVDVLERMDGEFSE